MMSREIEAEVVTGPVAWRVRFQPEETASLRVFEPNSFGKYGISLAFSAMPHDLASGLAFKPLAERRGLMFTHASSQYRPHIIIAPDDPVEVIRLEDAWLREYQLAHSCNRPPRLGEITVELHKFELSGRWAQGRDYTHALGLRSISIHEVGRS